jgi:hypothetical protein
MFVVSATGNHWWLDGIVAIVLLLIAIGIDSGVRRLVASRRVALPEHPTLETLPPVSV